MFITEPEHAVAIFMQRVTNRAYVSTIRDVKELLSAGPVERKPDLNDLELHSWYQGLDDHQKEYVEKVIQKTALHVIFGFLVVIDNESMGYPIEGQLSDFALYLQSYKDKTDRSTDHYQDRTRLNNPSNNFSLHDLINNYINFKR